MSRKSKNVITTEFIEKLKNKSKEGASNEEFFDLLSGLIDETDKRGTAKDNGLVVLTKKILEHDNEHNLKLGLTKVMFINVLTNFILSEKVSGDFVSHPTYVNLTEEFNTLEDIDLLEVFKAISKMVSWKSINSKAKGLGVGNITLLIEGFNEELQSTEVNDNFLEAINKESEEDNEEKEEVESIENEDPEEIEEPEKEVVTATGRKTKTRSRS